MKTIVTSAGQRLVSPISQPYVIGPSARQAALFANFLFVVDGPYDCRSFKLKCGCRSCFMVEFNDANVVLCTVLVDIILNILLGLIRASAV